MSPQPFHRPRLLILLGYIILTLGTAVTVWGERSHAPYPKSLRVYDIATVISFTLLGWAWWSLLAAYPSTPNPHPWIRASLRAFATAAAVLAVGYVALIRDVTADTVQTHGYFILIRGIYEFPDGRPVYKGLVLTVIGFCVVAIGFWWASRESVKSFDSTAVTETTEPVGAAAD